MPPGFSRSCQGCWTCRLRHRKCDEGQPECIECTSRHIPCHGYSSNPPEWMTDEGLLRSELQNIKRAVKENFRQKSLRRRPSGPKNPINGQSLARGSFKTSKQPPPKKQPPTASTSYPSFKEAKNFIYYLDYVFPLQYPYYIDDPDHGGRGWLLWLLMKSAPLRHATLTLAALHQHVSSPPQANNNEEQLLHHHSKALKELRLALSRRPEGGFVDHPEDWVEFVACTLTLISFQIFQGGLSDWEHHLKALGSVVCEFTELELSESSKQSEDADYELLQGINTAQRFLIAEMLWFDILACVSTGTAPTIPHREWLSRSSIDLSSVMGCQNWVMQAIGDVASIDCRVEDITPETLRVQVGEIEERIMQGLGAMDLEEKSDSNRNSLLVTRIFATATLVQLCCIAGDSVARPRHIRDAVARAIDAIIQIPIGVSLRGLPWPLCMAGAAAQQDQQPFFEDLFQSILSQPGSKFGNCETAFRIMEHCWYRRAQSPNETWGPRRAMVDMGICALLI